MSVVSLLVVILVLALVLYLIGLIPLDATALNLLRIAVVVLAIIWLLRGSGLTM